MPPPHRSTQAVLVQRYFPHYRRAIFRALARHPDLDFTLLHGQQDGPGGLVNVQEDDVIRRWVAPTRSVGPSRLNLYAMPHMLECARSGDYDVMILPNDLHCVTLWPTLRAIRKRGKKSIVFSIGFAQYPQFLRDKMRVKIAHDVNAMVLYSAAHREKFIKRGVAPDKIFVARNAVDTDSIETAEAKLSSESLNQFKAKHGLRESNTIIHAGRLVEYKRLDLLLRAAAKLKARRTALKLIFIGDGPMLTRWKQLATQLGLERHVLWPGTVLDQDELCYWFHSSDICVAPAQQGLIANLCHSYGVPLITSDNPTLQGPEIQVFTAGRTGLLYRFLDVNDLASIIDELLSDAGRRTAMGQEARRRIFADFTLEQMLQGFLAGIRYAMGEPSAAPKAALRP